MINFFQRNFKRLNNLVQYPELIQTIFNKINRDFCKELLFLKKEMNFNFSTIIDVGAAYGEYSKAANFIFQNAKVYAFEPIPDSFNKLKSTTQKNKVKIFNTALSNETGETKFNLNEFSFSSSLLKMTDTHKEIFPFTKGEKIINVYTDTLDNFINRKEIIIKGYTLLKLDVQGSELNVLKGATNELNNINAIQLELSFMPFYEGQATIEEIVRFLKPFGFSSFMQTEPVIQNHKLLYSDFIFIKN